MEDKTHQIIENTTYNGLKSGEDFTTIEIMALADKKGIDFENAAWLLDYDLDAPEHKGIWEAAEHFYYDSIYSKEQ